MTETCPLTRLPATSPYVAKRSAGRAGARHLLRSAVIGLALAGCSSAKVVSFEDVSKTPASRPTMVYVADFEEAPHSIQSEGLGALRPVHSYVEEYKARSLVATMSSSIVQDLAKKGISAERLPANSPLPKQGWLVRGVFTKIDEGSRARRAIIGFGSGETDIEVTASIDDLSAGSSLEPLYRTQTDATSSEMPGAVVKLNPYVIAAKFVLAGQDLDRSTRETAEEIADEAAARVKGMPGQSSSR